MFRFLSKEHEIAQEMYQVSSCCHGDVNDIIIIVTVIGTTVNMASKVSEDPGGIPP